jgi:SAM-dependent methyltransferase
MTSVYEKVFPNYADYVGNQLSAGTPRTEDVFIKYQEAYLAYFLSIISVPKTATILDLGCNAGQGILAWRSLGYSDSLIHGIDLNPQNVYACGNRGILTAKCADADNLSFIADNTYDVVYAMHSLEHMYSPSKVVSSCHRILKKEGHLLVVLPYPCGDSEGHLGGVELGICQSKGAFYTAPYDDGLSVCNFFKQRGFTVLAKKYDSFREPEIWLTLRKLI